MCGLLRYLFQIDGDGDPLEAAPVLEGRALPPAVRPVDHVLDRVPVLVVQVVAHLINTNRIGSISTSPYSANLLSTV